MKKYLITVLAFMISLLWWTQTLFANDMVDISFDSGNLKLSMNQYGSTLHLNATNIGWKSLSCQIQDGTTLHQRNNCQNVSFSPRSTEVTIYIQFANDQATVRYNTNTQRFVWSYYGQQNVDDTIYYPTPTPQPGRNTLSSLYLSLTPTTIRTSQRIDTTVQLRNRYNESLYSYRTTLEFSLEKKNTAWRRVSASTSDYTLSPVSRTVTTNQYGQVFFSQHIRISYVGEYRLTVTDRSTGIRTTQIITVITDSTQPTQTIDHIDSTIIPALPNASQWIDVELVLKNNRNQTISSTDRLDIVLERRTLPTSRLWNTTNINNYCRLWVSRVQTADYTAGTLSLDRVVNCTQKWFYRLKIVNNRTKAVLWYAYFTVLDSRDFVSTLAGFTSQQRQLVQEEYKNFMDQVNMWHRTYPKLVSNADWDKVWRDYYNVLNKLAYGKTGKLTSYNRYTQVHQTFLNDLYRLR